MAPLSPIISRLKVQLKLSISRLRMIQQKNEALAKQQRRAMAGLLETGKIESARIRTENIIRDDLTLELLEIIELYCELLIARSQLLDAPTCDPGLEEAVKSLIYAAPRTEVKELSNARALLIEKFGKEFALDAMEGDKVSERVLKKLEVKPPEEELVTLYLTEIAKTYRVDWPKGRIAAEAAAAAAAEAAAQAQAQADADNDDDDDDGEGGKGIAEPVKETNPPLLAQPSTPAKQSTAPPPGSISTAIQPPNRGASSPITINPPAPTSENRNPKLKLPTTAAGKSGGTVAAPPPKKKEDDGIPDVDELQRRFLELKRGL